MQTVNHSRFEDLPWLLLEHQVSTHTGYRGGTLDKLIDCGVLVVVKPPGSGQRRFRKVQIAKLLAIDVSAAVQAFQHEPPLLSAKTVCNWTGYTRRVLDCIAQAGGLQRLRPAGLTNGRFRKVEVAELLGFTR